MAKEDEIKIVPAKPVQKTSEQAATRPNYAPWVAGMIGAYFALVLMVSLLNLSGYMQVLALILGAFLIFDLLHSAKWFIKNMHDKRN